MRLAVLTPLPPVRSGIAHYSATLLPELARRHEVTAVVDQNEVAFDGCPWLAFDDFERRVETFDAVICQLGNNLFHEFAWSLARRTPTLVVLHEIVLHHLLVETTLARGNANGLVRELAAEYGQAGAAVAEARVAGLHGEIANFLMPASSRLANAARHVIVHNNWAAESLRSSGVSTPISVVQHPYDLPPVFTPEETAAVRQRAGWAETNRVIGNFGFVTEAKRPEVVMEAFSRAVRDDPSLRLVFVGEAAPNVDLRALANRFEVSDGIWRETGYVTDAEFDLWMNAVDFVVSLRYPTGGESSGPIVRAFAVGRPVAVNDYAQFSEFPSRLVEKISFDDEVPALARFMTNRTLDVRQIGEAQRSWLRSNATVEHTADGYDRALASMSTERSVSRTSTPEGLPLHPSIDVSLEATEEIEGRSFVDLRLTNRGDSLLACAVWGEPRYLLHATLIADDGSSSTASLQLPCDLRSGESVAIRLDHDGNVRRIELRHSLSGVPDVNRPAFASLEVGG